MTDLADAADAWPVLAALTELRDWLSEGLSNCVTGEAKTPALTEGGESTFNLQRPLLASAAAVPETLRIPPGALGTERRDRPGTLELFFPGFQWNSVLVRLSVTEMMMFLMEQILTAGDLSSCAMVRLGAGWAPLVVRGDWWRLTMPIFLHGNFGHVLTNVIFQLRFGFKIEQLLGQSRFLFLYLASGTFGNLLSAALDPGKVAVGASTSAMGILGANTIRAILDEEGPAKQAVLISSILILVAINLSPHADVLGHVGGFVSGMLLTLCMKPGMDRRVRVVSAVPLGLATGGSVALLHWLGRHVDTAEALSNMDTVCPQLLSWLHHGAEVATATVAYAKL